MDIKIVVDKISMADLKKIAGEIFGDMVKVVVDIEKNIMAVGGSMHADEEAALLEKGSKQKNLWGINIYPAQQGDDMIEFNSMINLRPSQGNKTRGVESSDLREKIIKIVNSLIK